MSPQPLVSVIIRSMGRPKLAEALEVGCPAADPGLRASMGAAARRKLTAVMRDQEARILAYYLEAA
jgi:hypothetical protein